MIKHFVLLALALGVLAGCSTSGKPLPLVEKNDPTFALTPDHLDNAELPR